MKIFLAKLTVLALALIPAGELCLAQSGSAATGDETAEALLERVAETYRSLDRFYFSATEQTRTHSEQLDRRTESQYVAVEITGFRITRRPHD